MKTIPLALTSLLAITMSAAAWAMPPASEPVKAPLEGMPKPAPEVGTTPKGVSAPVWRQYAYDHESLKLNGPNNGKPETKLQIQQAQLDKISGANAVVGAGRVIKGVGGIEDNGTNTPVILKLSSQKVTLPGGEKVTAYRLADGNLYYKAPETGMPTKLGFAAPEAARGGAQHAGKLPAVDIADMKSLGRWINHALNTQDTGDDQLQVAGSDFDINLRQAPPGTPAPVVALYTKFSAESGAPGASSGLYKFKDVIPGTTLWGVQKSAPQGDATMIVFDGAGREIGTGSNAANGVDFKWSERK